ncbi:MAG: hypothetical protein Q4C50_01975 [Eubacteriales bacterium]|nr:hypothetical protein [Eubacteriales bacterium]
MKKQKFAILDMETTYALHLMDYLAEHQGTALETMVFDSMESLKHYVRQSALDLLLVSERMMCDEIRRMNIGKIIVLAEGDAADTEDCPAVYKYQPSDSLVAEVMSCYAFQEIPQAKFLKKKQTKVYGVYSPVGRCGKTCFALTLGQILSRRQPVLYLNLEDYAGFTDLMGKEAPSDLSDVMYFVRQNRGNIVMKLSSALQKLGGMDYIAPTFQAADLREIDVAEWMRLLDELIAYSQYEAVILDIGQTVKELFLLLSQCHRIYMPVCTDMISEAKICQYEQLLQEMEYGELLEKTKKLVLPFCAASMRGDYFLEQLVQGTMGDYVRELLRQEAEDESETDRIL